MFQKIVLLTVLGTLAAAVVIIAGKRAPSGSPVEDAVSFLKDREDVRWHKVDGTNVVICFHSGSNEIEPVIRRAAVLASRTSDDEFHVWAVVKANHNWTPGSDPPAVMDVVAKNGRIP